MKARHERLLAVINGHKIECIKCGFSNRAALQFHHRVPVRQKRKMHDFAQYSVKAILKEISECDVLCANCHCIHHQNENGNTT